MAVASPTVSSPRRAGLTRRDLLRRPVSPGRRDRPAGSGPGPDATWLRVHRTAMACRFEVTLGSEDGRHVGAAHAALAEATRLDAAWSVFRDTSLVSEVNRRAAHQAVVVDADLASLLTTCRTLHGETEGAHDLTSTPLSRCWGFLARAGRLPSPAEIEAARAMVGMPHVVLDDAACTVRFTRPGVSLNLGSVGKGYAVGVIARRLAAAGVRHALVSAGGSSIAAVGGRDGGWAIDVCSRQATQGPLAQVRLRDGAMATSGAGEQFAVIDGRRYGHVIDPRTGWPAAGWRSVTVITRDGAEADALATAFFVGGVDLARRYCGRHPDTLALLTPEAAETRTLVIGRYGGARLAPSATLVEVS